MEKRDKGNAGHSIRFIRKRKFLLVLPVLVMPFLILLIWTFGLVGEVNASVSSGSPGLTGLNLNLPSAVPGKDSAWDKLRYYEQADKDSLKLRSLLKNDPYRAGELVEPSDTILPFAAMAQERSVFNPPHSTKTPDENEVRVYKKLSALNKELESAAERDRQPKPATMFSRDTAPLIAPHQVDRLERMMYTMNEQKQEDPEMTQLNQLLEKVLDIQHPERAQEKLRVESQANKQRVYAVETPVDNMASLLEPGTDYMQFLHSLPRDSVPRSMRAMLGRNRFYSMDEFSEPLSASTAIAAVVHEDQTLVSGGAVRLRLQQDVLVAGVRIPKDHFVFAEATLNGERLQLSVSSIQHKQYILPVALTVYDSKDGMAGIQIPGAITRDVAKRSAAQSAQGLGALNTLDPSIGATLASTGLQAAQNLVGKTAKLVQVTVTAGYPVLLKDDNVDEK